MWKLFVDGTAQLQITKCAMIVVKVVIAFINILVDNEGKKNKKHLMFINIALDDGAVLYDQIFALKLIGRHLHIMAKKRKIWALSFRWTHKTFTNFIATKIQRNPIFICVRDFALLIRSIECVGITLADFQHTIVHLRKKRGNKQKTTTKHCSKHHWNATAIKWNANKRDKWS